MKQVSIKDLHEGDYFILSSTGAYDKLMHQENFFITAPVGVSVDDDYISNNIRLCDSLSVSILANCSLLKTFYMVEFL